MEFQGRKLRLALGIMAVGMLIALAWHTWLGWGLGMGYPCDTFLFRPDYRYSDFIDVLSLAAKPGVQNNYFPAAYLLYYPFLHVTPLLAAVVFLDFWALMLFMLLYVALRPLVPGPLHRLAACAVFMVSFPVLYCLDRGNNEVLLIFLAGLALYFYQKKQFTLSFLALLPPILFKLYPGLLLLIFFRRSQRHFIFAGAAAFVAINGALMLTYPGSLAENLHSLLDKMSIYSRVYVMGWEGIATSASAWNLYRFSIWLVYSWHHGVYTWPLPPGMVETAFRTYNLIFLGVLSLVMIYVALVERVFARRAVAVLIYLTVSAPGGGDYKLMYAELALITLLLARDRRPRDLLVTAFLALAVLPKRFFFLVFLGPSDSQYPDASPAFILTPPCLLAALAFLMLDGWRAAQPWNWPARLQMLAGVLVHPLPRGFLRRLS